MNSQSKPNSGCPLFSSNQHFSLTVALLDELSEGIFVFNEQLLLVGWNRHFFELLGSPPKLDGV